VNNFYLNNFFNGMGGRQAVKKPGNELNYMATRVDGDSITGSVLSIGNQIGDALSEERGPFSTRNDLAVPTLATPQSKSQQSFPCHRPLIG